MNEFSKIILTNPFIVRLITQGVSNPTLMNALTFLSIMQPSMDNAPLASMLWNTIFTEARKANILATSEEQKNIEDTVRTFGMDKVLNWKPR